MTASRFAQTFAEEKEKEKMFKIKIATKHWKWTRSSGYFKDNLKDER